MTLERRMGYYLCAFLSFSMNLHSYTNVKTYVAMNGFASITLKGSSCNEFQRELCHYYRMKIPNCK